MKFSAKDVSFEIGRFNLILIVVIVLIAAAQIVPQDPAAMYILKLTLGLVIK